MDDRKKRIVIESLKEGLDFGDVPGQSLSDIDDVLLNQLSSEESQSLVDSWFLAFSSRIRRQLMQAEKSHEVAALKASIDSAEVAAKMMGHKLNQNNKQKASKSITMKFVSTNRT